MMVWRQACRILAGPLYSLLTGTGLPVCREYWLTMFRRAKLIWT
ncbi:hypothetical protein MCHI_003837 [Candidatus Magnetoovum chiemensis]|nr:hypothetical protein MCHI_003837 [Candidatus Magnetoovum chiemensis]